MPSQYPIAKRVSVFLTLILSSFYFINPTYPLLYPSHRSEVPRGVWTISAISNAKGPEIPPCPQRGLANYRRNSPLVEHLLLNISSLLQPRIPRGPLLAKRERPEHSNPGNTPRTCSSERNRVILDEAPPGCPGQQHRRTGCSLFCAGPANYNDFYVVELVENCFSNFRAMSNQQRNYADQHNCSQFNFS